MCSHYQAPTSLERIRLWAGLRALSGPQDLGRADVWPLYRAPILRQDPDQAENILPPGTEPMGFLDSAQFGMLAHWAKDIAQARKTYNARTETVAQKPTFRDAWRRGQRCVIPADWIYEPSWETGKAVPWKISRVDGQPLGIAGLWSSWRAPAAGEELMTFTMLTVNATDHPLMRRFHRPDDEKRMVVILDQAQFASWLACPVDQMMGMMRQYPADLLTSEAAPAPARVKAAPAKPEPSQGELL